MSNAEKFWNTYEKNLAQAVRTSPQDYPPGSDPAAYAKKVADKFRAAPFSEIDHEGRGFRLTCKELGIKQTRRGIQEFLKS